MEVSTESSDQQVTPQEKLIEFPRGLPGFEDHRRFRLLHEEGSTDPAVYRLQSMHDETVQLPVTHPARLQVNYEVTLSDEECLLLQLDSAEQCAVLIVLYREGDDSSIHANFLAPLLINTERRIGLQKMLNTADGTVTIQSR